MAGDDDSDDGEKEIEALWNPPKQQASPPAKKPLELVVANGKEAYQALTHQKAPYRCAVYPQSSALYTIFSYHQLGDIDCSPTHDFVMFRTQSKFIRIYGCDLQPLVLALTLQTCKAIYAYSKDKHLHPAPHDGEPFIDRIEITDLRAEATPRLSKPQRAGKAEAVPEEA